MSAISPTTLRFGQHPCHPVEGTLVGYLGWNTLLGRGAEHLSLDCCFPLLNGPAPRGIGNTWRLGSCSRGGAGRRITHGVETQVSVGQVAPPLFVTLRKERETLVIAY